MGESAPVADAEIRLSSGGGKTRFWTRKEIPAARGLVRLRQLTVGDLIPQAAHKAGMIEYSATDRALAALSNVMTFSRETLLS